MPAVTGSVLVASDTQRTAPPERPRIAVAYFFGFAFAYFFGGSDRACPMPIPPIGKGRRRRRGLPR